MYITSLLIHSRMSCVLPIRIHFGLILVRRHLLTSQSPVNGTEHTDAKVKDYLRARASLIAVEAGLVDRLQQSETEQAAIPIDTRGARPIKSRAVYEGGTCLSDLFLQRLRVSEAMQAGLKTMSKKEVEALLQLAKYLIFSRPDWYKIPLGVSQGFNYFKKMPWDWKLEEANLRFKAK